MILKYSMKQLIRTPLKTILFFSLTTVSVMLFVLGLNLFFLNIRDTMKFEELFTTIGTAKQLPEKTKLVEVWDAALDTSYYASRNDYGEWVDDSVLGFEGANYMIEPVKRPYFGAYVPDLKIGKYGREINGFWLVEFTPLETKTADPIPVYISNVLYGTDVFLDKVIWICEHNNKYPTTLEEGKTYITQLQGPISGHDTNGEYFDEDLYGEWNPFERESTQYDVKGECIGALAGGVLYEEVTEGFYDTESGKKWMSVIEAQNYMEHTIPVEPVSDTNLLMAFHDKKAYISQGRDITDEEYKKGKDVCLVPETFAEMNGLKVGDCIELPLYYASYRSAPTINFKLGGFGYEFSFLNSQGQVYPVFDQDTYEIVGIYNMDIYDYSELGLSDNEVIIPYNSVKHSWENNIVSDGPMTEGTTTFQIPNGEIDSFMEKWNAQGVDNVKITFYDGGYSVLKENINNRKIMAYILVIGGGIISVLILLLFCHLFITKQEKRTAIERSLGMSKQQSAKSMLSGFFLIIMLSTVTGCSVGCFAVEKTVVKEIRQEQLYDTTYTNGQTISDTENMSEELEFQESNAVASSAVGGILILIMAMGIAAGYMKVSLEKEPVRLLTGGDE